MRCGLRPLTMSRLIGWLRIASTAWLGLSSLTGQPPAMAIDQRQHTNRHTRAKSRPANLSVGIRQEGYAPALISQGA
jgi:hypothetical protein